MAVRRIFQRIHALSIAYLNLCTAKAQEAYTCGMEPLASKIRPTSLEEFVGQEHLVGKGKPLREAIEQKHLFSFILWGPPGSGKTTLARLYANALNADFYE